jgi:hypothetical protein
VNTEVSTSHLATRQFPLYVTPTHGAHKSKIRILPPVTTCEDPSMLRHEPITTAGAPHRRSRVWPRNSRASAAAAAAYVIFILSTKVTNSFLSHQQTRALLTILQAIVPESSSRKYLNPPHIYSHPQIARKNFKPPQ